MWALLVCWGCPVIQAEAKLVSVWMLQQTGPPVCCSALK